MSSILESFGLETFEAEGFNFLSELGAPWHRLEGSQLRRGSLPNKKPSTCPNSQATVQILDFMAQNCK